ncbi:MAG TPA: ParB/RepB/Spo0J family partition protein [Candidatus Eisenbacteria bacterium]|nr:ParB/RepB/Spo0J family partition protein [Candidatus Eisenbacteria bacterium]
MRFEAVTELPLHRLEISKGQARIRDVEKDLDELVENLRTHGQLEPIVVARIRNTDKYEIITGQRRFLAHKRLGWSAILAAILPEAVDHATARALSISENVVRTELNPKDLIDACTAMYKKYGSVRAVAEELGLAPHKVATYVKYERLGPELRGLVDAGEVEINLALRVQDTLEHVEPKDGIDTVLVTRNLKRMSRAQQSAFLRNASVDDLRHIATSDRTGESRRVTQVIVTLPITVHRQLQEWAKRHGLTQDGAAAQMIISSLQGVEPAAPPSGEGRAHATNSRGQPT